MTSLYQYDHDEWWDIIRFLRPDITEREFEEMWYEFLKLKDYRTLH